MMSGTERRPRPKRIVRKLCHHNGKVDRVLIEQVPAIGLQLRCDPLRDPRRAARGYSPAVAAWVWGISNAEYERPADVWPLNPDGEQIAIMMIKSTEGVKNADAIPAVPGVGAIFLGAGQSL